MYYQESAKIYYDKNKERLCAERRARYALNKEKEIATVLIYRSKNLDKINARRRALYAQRRDAKQALIQKQFMIILDQ